MCLFRPRNLVRDVGFILYLYFRSESIGLSTKSFLIFDSLSLSIISKMSIERHRILIYSVIIVLYALKFLTYFTILFSHKGPDSIDGIATGYGLDGPRVESRWEARFSTPVHTGPGAHLASCTMGTGSSPEVKNGRGVTLTPYPVLVPWSWKVRSITLLPLWAVRPVQSLSACTRVQFKP
jgi:hypothetical protein